MNHKLSNEQAYCKFELFFSWAKQKDGLCMNVKPELGALNLKLKA